MDDRLAEMNKQLERIPALEHDLGVFNSTILK